MSLRAFYEQRNNYGTLDRIEIYDSNFTGTAIQFEGRAPIAFDFEHREITSEQKEYLSLFENQIIMGVLDLYLRIDTTAKETFLTDLADAPAKQFKIEWKRDGVTKWEGYPYGRIVEFPERPQYNVKIQFRDFEILKGSDFPLEDVRGHVITTITRCLDEAGYNNKIVSGTSWEVENTGLATDFLDKIYHDTFALRNYAGDGFSEDQNISYYQALLRCLDPMLIIYQYEGFQIRQISALNFPTDVRLTTFVNGTQDAFTLADLRLQVGATAEQTPNATVSTNNTSYPALRKAIYEFKHRSGSSEIEFDNREDSFVDTVDFQGNLTASSSLSFAGNGDEQIFFSARYITGSPNTLGRFAIRAGEYAIDDDGSWQRPEDHSRVGTTAEPADFNTDTGDILLGQGSVLFEVGNPVMLQGNLPTGFSEDNTYYVVFRDSQFIRLSDSPGGSAVIPEDQGTGTIILKPINLTRPTEATTQFRKSDIDIQSADIPPMSDTSIEVSLMIYPNQPNDRWYFNNATIINPTQAGESIEYRLTQENIYPDEFRLNDSYFGDGPYQYSKSSYRFSENLSDITSGWRRRGDTAYVRYSRLKLNEVLDYQRKRQLKKNFRINGEFDPTLVTVYKGDNYMYVGGSYSGKWNPVMVKIEENRA